MKECTCTNCDCGGQCTDKCTCDCCNRLDKSYNTKETIVKPKRNKYVK